MYDRVEYRHFEDETSATPGWGAWMRVIPTAGQTVEEKVNEIMYYIDNGYKYEIRGLNTVWTYPEK